MALGRPSLPIDLLWSGDPSAGHRDFYMAARILGQELAISAGNAALPCTENIMRGRAVNIFNGKLRLASRGSAISAQGVCVRAADAGQSAGFILCTGYAGGLSGLVPHASYYLGDAGALIPDKPTGGHIQYIGYALSATELLVNIGPA